MRCSLFRILVRVLLHESFTVGNIHSMTPETVKSGVHPRPFLTPEGRAYREDSHRTENGFGA
jgi:hypothetical protein